MDKKETFVVIILTIVFWYVILSITYDIGYRNGMNHIIDIINISK